jgi:CubicO group peptidase (beta-lactamase class C family)
MLLPLISLTVALAIGDPPAVRPARTVGMAPERLAEVNRIVRRGIAVGAYPGAAVVIGRRGSAVLQRGYGKLSWRQNAAPVDPARTIYDLASLTKPVCLATAAMVLYDEGKLPLDQKVQEILPEFTGRWKERVTVGHLLSHTAGLPAGRPIWRTAKSPMEGREQILSTDMNAMPGDSVDYSDVGAITLGLAIERVAGMPLDQFCESRIFRPLGMDDTRYRPAATLRRRIAPTEQRPPRGHPAHGEVHDETAYTLGGVSGNAGLFSTATDLAIFAQMMLNRGTYGGVRIIQDSTVRQFTRLVMGNRTYGWETPAMERGSGEFLSANAYGHVGYTGTSLWIDPDRELYVILLTNRVHEPRARRPGIIIADIRHDITDAAGLAIVDDQALRAIPWPRNFRVDIAADWNPPTTVAVRRPTTVPRQSAASSPDASTSRQR